LSYPSLSVGEICFSPVSRATGNWLVSQGLEKALPGPKRETDLPRQTSISTHQYRHRASASHAQGIGIGTRIGIAHARYIGTHRARHASHARIATHRHRASASHRASGIARYHGIAHRTGIAIASASHQHRTHRHQASPSYASLSSIVIVSIKYQHFGTHRIGIVIATRQTLSSIA
jgi:hypothetical protein